MRGSSLMTYRSIESPSPWGRVGMGGLRWRRTPTPGPSPTGRGEQSFNVMSSCCRRRAGPPKAESPLQRLLSYMPVNCHIPAMRISDHTCGNRANQNDRVHRGIEFFLFLPAPSLPFWTEMPGLPPLRRCWKKRTQCHLCQLRLRGPHGCQSRCNAANAQPFLPGIGNHQPDRDRVPAQPNVRQK